MSEIFINFAAKACKGVDDDNDNEDENTRYMLNGKTVLITGAVRCYKHGLALPMCPSLKEEEQEWVIEKVKTILANI